MKKQIGLTQFRYVCFRAKTMPQIKGKRQGNRVKQWIILTCQMDIGILSTSWVSIPGKFQLLGLYFQNSIQNFLSPKFNTKQFIRGLSFNFHLRISLMSFSNLKLFCFIHFNTCNEWLTKPNTVPKSTFINKWIQPDKWHIPRHSNTSWDLETTFSEIKDFRF